MQDEMINKDTVTKQEEKLQNLTKEVNGTDESIQTEQLLNLQLSSEYNTIMTDLSHILNQRNSLLIECEGLKDTIILLNNQLQEIKNAVEEEQSHKKNLQEQLQEVELKLSSWKEEYAKVSSQYQESPFIIYY